MRDLCACTRRRHERSSHAPGDASFARSSDPCTSILTMLRGRKLSEVGRRQRHHGWESSRKREEPSLGSRSPDVARLAAYHRFRKGEGVIRREKEGDRGLRPCEDREEPGFGCPHVVMQLQKSVGDDWSRISSAYAPQKGRSGSSERGPSSERGSAGETVGRHIERKVSSRVGLTAKDGRAPAEDPG